jgi:hypothetical protein
MLNELQGNCCSKCHSNVDCQQIECEKCYLKESVSATSTKTLPSKVTDTHEVLLHDTRNKSNGLRDCSLNCDAGFQDMSSCLSQALK